MQTTLNSFCFRKSHRPIPQYYPHIPSWSYSNNLIPDDYDHEHEQWPPHRYHQEAYNSLNDVPAWKYHQEYRERREILDQLETMGKV